MGLRDRVVINGFSCAMIDPNPSPELLYCNAHHIACWTLCIATKPTNKLLTDQSQACGCSLVDLSISAASTTLTPNQQSKQSKQAFNRPQSKLTSIGVGSAIFLLRGLISGLNVHWAAWMCAAKAAHRASACRLSADARRSMRSRNPSLCLGWDRRGESVAGGIWHSDAEGFTCAGWSWLWLEMVVGGALRRSS